MSISFSLAVALLGFCAAGISCLTSLPQAARALREPPEHLIGISRWTWRIIAFNAALWLIWALLVGRSAPDCPR